MTTIQLKTALIKKISEIDDIPFLEALKTILDSKTESKTIYLTPDIVSKIEKSREDIKKGLYIDNSVLENEVKARLILQNSTPESILNSEYS